MRSNTIAFLAQVVASGSSRDLGPQNAPERAAEALKAALENNVASVQTSEAATAQVLLVFCFGL